MSRTLKIVLGFIVMVLGSATGFVYLAPEKAAEMAVSGERDTSGLTRKEITLANGLTYVYLEGGQGEPLMLLHGFGANKDNFTRVAKYLTPHFRVIAPDHIGFGESSHPQDASYTPLAQVERLHQLAAALGLKALHLGGGSMGGHIAASWAATYPDEVKSLWLLAPGGVWSSPKSELTQVIEATGKNPLMATTEDEFAGIFAFVMSEPPFIPRPILNVFAQERIKNHALETRIFEEIRGDGIEPRVTGLQTPALIVWGEQDRALHPGGAEILHKLMPNSKVLLMPGIGHLPMLERAEGSAQDYLAFRAALQ